MVTIKLSSTNYLLWKNRFMPILHSQQLLYLVEGESKIPPKTIMSATGSSSPNPAYTTWFSADQRLLMLINSTLTEESMALVVGCTTSRGVWTTLKTSFSNNSLQRQNQIRRTLQALNKGAQSVSAYASQFKASCDQLAAMGFPVSDSDKLQWFLQGLGESFSTFSTIQMSTSPTPSFSDLVSRALNHEIFQSAIQGSPSPSAAFVANSNGRSGGGLNRGNYHNQNTNAGRGHSHGQNRHHNNYGGQSRSQHHNNYGGKAGAFNTSCSLNSGEASDWFVDTGASAHMTPTPSNLDSVEPYMESQDRKSSGSRAA